MTDKPKQTCAFPAATETPEAHRVSPVEQMEYLVGGELRSWAGPSQEVLSPICVRQDGGISQKVLGHYPLLGVRPGRKRNTPAVTGVSGEGRWKRVSSSVRICRARRGGSGWRRPWS